MQGNDFEDTIGFIINIFRLASEFADRMLDEGIYVIGFSYPVVPMNRARIRVQISAAHTKQHIDTAIDAFTRIGTQLGVIS